MEGWIIFICAVALVLALIAVRSSVHKPPKKEKKASIEGIDTEAAQKRLCGALQIPTVSCEEQSDYSAFERFLEYLKESYPAVFAEAKAERVLKYGLLLEIAGEEGGIVLMGHYDVVAADGGWSYPPFGAEEHDGYIYARGAIDMKGQVIAIFEALEYYLKKGAKPKKTVYVWLGFDEEISSAVSAQKAAELLERRGVKADYVLDECGGFIDGAPFKIDGKIALVGICEKGYADIKVSAKGEAGHSSMPPKTTALGVVAAGITRLQNRSNKERLTKPVKNMVLGMAPYMHGAEKLFFSNTWLFFPWVKDILTRIPMGGAWLKTTYAPTMASASTAANVLPDKAEAVINVRILPGESIADAVEHISLITGLSAEVIATATEPTPVSPVGAEFENIKQAIEDTFGVPAVPSINVMATDSRFFYRVSDSVYRFVPFPSIAEDVGRMHANDERIELLSFKQGIDFFVRLLKKDMGE